MELKSRASQLCGLSAYGRQMDANEASEIVTTEKRDPTDWQMGDKLDIQLFQVDVWHVSLCMSVGLLVHMCKSYNMSVHVAAFALMSMHKVPVCVCESV